MPNTLGLDDDLDPVEAIVGLEKAFALNISDEEAVSCATVGDIYDLLHSRFAAQIGTGGACMTSMAFYRLRKALRRTHPEADLRPGTVLADYARSDARGFLDQLHGDSGLLMPRSQGRLQSAVGCLLVLAAFAAVVLAAINQAPFWFMAAISLVVGGLALVRLDPGGLPESCATLGGLATKASALNFGMFARSGGAVRAEGLWDAMTEVLSELSDLSKADIRRDTFILQEQPG